MFSVYFGCNANDGSENPVHVFHSDKDVEAVQFALSLHQASNVPHTISVFTEGDHCICDLILKSK